MKLFQLVDSRSIEWQETFNLFKNEKDANDMKESMGSDGIFFKVLEVEVIE